MTQFYTSSQIHLESPERISHCFIQWHGDEYDLFLASLGTRKYYTKKYMNVYDFGVYDTILFESYYSSFRKNFMVEYVHG